MLTKRRSLINSDEKRKALQNVAVARGRLKGALKTVNPSSDESTSSDDNAEHSRRKRHRSEKSPSAYRPFVITLFHRGIDIARFRENSPIYPLCRAWVKNDPRESETAIKEDYTPDLVVKREHNPDIVDQFLYGDLEEITEMPRSEPAKGMEPFLLQKAEPVDDFDINQSSLDKDELIKEHIVKWKKIRESFIAHRKKYNEARYGTSFKLLDALRK